MRERWWRSLFLPARRPSGDIHEHDRKAAVLAGRALRVLLRQSREILAGFQSSARRRPKIFSGQCAV